ncbi:MAG: DHH family phosphoesterase [Oscillospiraceae bacterium]|jgi:c-di-AMP phosphodiesterase-like protein|nr:DHH family phosphoesterase [Oscillospiraceae bacterium]
MKRKREKPFKFYLGILAVVLGFSASIAIFLKPQWILEVVLLFVSQITVGVMAVFLIKLRLKKMVLNVDESLKDSKRGDLEKFSVPVLVASKSGNIVYYNSAFRKKICPDENLVFSSLKSLISDRNLIKLFKCESVDIIYNQKQYTVFGQKTVNSMILYFFEDTYYKLAAKNYEEKKVCICLATFDNKEEMVEENTESGKTRVVGQVEGKLQNFGENAGGFFKKISSNKYLIIIEEKALRKLIIEKFNILQQVKEIRDDNGVEATISIGVGRNANNLKEGEVWAKKALDMALGRGGDQVVVKSANSYLYFGGTSKNSQSRNKVKVRVVSNALLNHIMAADKVLTMGHEFSDFDSIGAATGIHAMATRGCKKSSFVVVNRNQGLAEKLVKKLEKAEKDLFISPEKALTVITPDTLLVILDTHSKNRFESLELYEAASQVVVIDHHRLSEDYIKNTLMFYHDPFSSSASEMVTELITYQDENILTKIYAQSLLTGIMLDTKDFSLKTNVRTFEAAAFLRKRNADAADSKMFFAKTLDTCKKKSRLIASVEIFDSFAITYASEESNDIRLVASSTADELLEIEGVKASFVLYPYRKGIGISSRSLDKINVQIIMEKLSGGGHYSAAAVWIPGAEIEEIKLKLLNILQSPSDVRVQYDQNIQ